MPAIANLALGILRPSLYDDGIWSFNGFIQWNQINSFSVENDRVILHINLYIYKDIIFKGNVVQKDNLITILKQKEIIEK